MKVTSAAGVPPWRGGRGGKLLALAIGTSLSLLLAEGGLRLAGFGWPVFSRPDPTYGIVHIPGAEGWFVNEGRAYVSINDDGLRDVHHSRAKPPATVRIAVLGDSYAEAFQVPREETFWSLLGEQLAACGALRGRSVEMLNFGVSGYTTSEEYLVLERRVWAYAPDLVVLALVTGNDIADNHPALGVAGAPFYRFEGDRLVLDPCRIRPLGAGSRALLWLFGRSRTAQLFNQVRLMLKAHGWGGARGPDRDAALGEAGLQNQVYVEPRDNHWREAWRVTEELLRRVRDEVAAHHARFLLVTLSNGIQVHPDPAVRERFRRELGVPDLFYPDRRLAEFARREGIPALTLAPPMLEYATRDRRYLHGFGGPNLGKGHWNRDGHRLAAATIAPWLCESLIDAAAAGR